MLLGDEHPVEFGGLDKTYEDRGATHVHISMPKDMEKKRVASLVLYFRAEAPQCVRPQIIFRLAPLETKEGEYGMFLSFSILLVLDPLTPTCAQIRKEMSRYSPDVDVLFQPKAWADDVTATASLKLFAEQTKECGEKMLEMDNLHGHKCQSYAKVAREERIEVAFSPEDCTDICAVNDHHLGKIVKDHMKASYRRDYQNNREAWRSMPLSEKRIKYTFWLAEAWAHIKTMQESITAAFYACGVLGAVDGSDDHKIKLGNEQNYKVGPYEPYESDEDEDAG